MRRLALLLLSSCTSETPDPNAHIWREPDVEGLRVTDEADWREASAKIAFRVTRHLHALDTLAFVGSDEERERILVTLESALQSLPGSALTTLETPALSALLQPSIDQGLIRLRTGSTELDSHQQLIALAAEIILQGDDVAPTVNAIEVAPPALRSLLEAARADARPTWMQWPEAPLAPCAVGLQIGPQRPRRQPHDHLRRGREVRRVHRVQRHDGHLPGDTVKHWPLIVMLCAPIAHAGGERLDVELCIEARFGELDTPAPLPHGAKLIDAARCWNGETLLIAAVQENHARTVRQLLERGADINRVVWTGERMSALCMAQRLKLTAMEALLRARGAVEQWDGCPKPRPVKPSPPESPHVIRVVRPHHQNSERLKASINALTSLRRGK